MSLRVEGKVALITGAARGQGRAHAVRLAEEGADIIAVDICAPIPEVLYDPATEADLAQTVKEVESLGRRVVSAVVDTRDQAALQAVVDAGVADLGGLDIVVANAGICIVATWDKVTEEIFRQTMDVNVFGTWNTLMVSVPHLQARGGGSIIVTSSSAGLKGLPFLAPYAASKHAVLGLARTFAAELAKDNIRVNTLHPSGVATEMSSERANAGFGPALEANPGVGGMLVNMLPLEISEPRDQSHAVLFLASDESRFVTALPMMVDAGNAHY